MRGTSCSIYRAHSSIHTYLATLYSMHAVWAMRWNSLLATVDCLRVQAEPLLLRRVIMNTIPRFGTRYADGSSSSSDTNTTDNNAAEGCCPYIQVFKGGRLVFTTTYVPSHDSRHTPQAITAAASTDTATTSATSAATADATAVVEVDQQRSGDAAAGDSSADPTAATVAAADTDTGATDATADDTTAADNSTATAAESSTSRSNSAAQTEAPNTTATATVATPTAAAAAATTAAAALPWAYTSDESIAFSVDCVVQGDLLLRCRHLGPNGQRVSMFRAAFHTGYVPCGVLRLSKAQLDGACGDPRFDEVSLL
jgi:C2 domain of PTEN tumour-suppressor protein